MKKESSKFKDINEAINHYINRYRVWYPEDNISEEDIYEFLYDKAIKNKLNNCPLTSWFKSELLKFHKRYIKALTEDPISLNSPELINIQYEININQFDLKDQLLQIINNRLTPRQSFCIRAFYNMGLSQKESQDLINSLNIKNTDEINLSNLGEYFGVGRERIRQIIAKSIRLLKTSKDIKKLKIYIRE